MVANGRWQWLKPPTLVTTQCSGFPCAFNSVLDFVFVAGPAQAWPATSEIVVRPGDLSDDMTTSDHRPVRATFTLPGAEPEPFKTPMFLPFLRVAPPAQQPESTATPTTTPTATATRP